MTHRSKKAFTLLELLVVVGIIGILAAAFVFTIGSGTEAARAAKCKSNLKRLASAWGQAAANDDDQYYPTAGSVEHMDVKLTGNNSAKSVYWERPGWISWNSQGTYKNSPQSHAASLSWFTSAYDTDKDARLYVLTNGTLWVQMDGNMESYRCPNHLRACEEEEMLPNWSYVMNAWYGWDRTMGNNASGEWPKKVTTTGLRPDKRILFAELQWTDYTGDEPSFNASSGTENDCTLQYKGSGGSATPESIGFNHKSGGEVVAHVVYASGRVDEIMWKEGQDLQELTKWLCEGTDISFTSSGTYDELK